MKIRDSHLTCKAANKCLHFRERVEVVEWNKRWSPPFPCCSVSCQCLCKKTLKEKKIILAKRFWVVCGNKSCNYSLWYLDLLIVKFHIHYKKKTRDVMRLKRKDLVISLLFPVLSSLTHFECNALYQFFNSIRFCLNLGTAESIL